MTFETYLQSRVQAPFITPLDEAMHYALTAGGKRIRPALFFSVLKSYGVLEEPYYPVALAVEKVHTYSLVHDDLPAMDDDDMRRNQPTVHKKFNEWLAILAGDALLTDAFFDLTQCTNLSAQEIKDLVRILSLKAGSKGMVLGQTIDMNSENQAVSLETLKTIHQHKTANLIEASLMMGAVIAAPEEQAQWEAVGHHLGMIFQIQDDILEHTSDEATLGKSKTDDRKQKQTYVSVLGLEKAQEALTSHHHAIRDIVEAMFINPNPFMTLLADILKRSH